MDELKRRFSLSTIILAVTACLLWSTAFVGVKIGLRYAKPLSFAGTRFMLSGLLLIPFWGRFPSVVRTFWANRRTILLVSFFQTFLLYGLFYNAMTLVPGSLGAIIVGAAPLISALTAHFLMPDDEMTFSKTLNIVIGMAGIVIISLSRQPWSAAGWKEFLGVILLIVASISSAMGNVIVAKEDQNVHPLLLNSAQIFIGGFFLLLISIPFEGLPRFDLPAPFYGALLWLSVLSAVAFSAWFTLLKRPDVKVSELNLWKFIIPVFGAVLSWLLLPEESPELLSIIGMLCVAGSVLSFNLSRK
jgi:drug/metabolite transporter (DMT)-like permease